MLPRRTVLLLLIALVALAGAGLLDRLPTAPPPPPVLGGGTEVATAPAELPDAAFAPLLAAGDEIRALLGNGERHLYRLVIAAGHAARVEVEQGGRVDVELALHDGAGRTLHFVDTPSGRAGSETLSLVMPAEPCFLSIASYPGEPAGEYRLRLAGGAPATEADWTAVEAEREFRRGRRWERWSEGPEPGIALRRAGIAFRRAAELWELVGDPRAARFAWPALGEVAGAAGRSASAHAAWERAWNGLSRREPDRETARVAYELSVHVRDRGDAVRALELARYARDLARRLGRPVDVARYAGAVGEALDDLGEPMRAVEAYAEALAIHRRQGRPAEVAHNRNRIGEVYRGMGDLERAAESFGAALACAREAGDLENQARALDGLGTLDRRRYDEAMEGGLLRRAEDRFYTALGLYRRIGDAEGEAVVLANLGRIYRLLDEPERALELYREAAARLEGMGEEEDAAVVRVNLAWLEYATGRRRPALRSYRRALEVCRRRGDEPCEASASYGLARLAADAGALDRARSLIERSVAIVEELRSRGDSEMRLTFLGDKYDYYLLWADVLRRLDRRHPDGGHLEASFAAGERGRARVLLDLLAAPEEVPSRLLGVEEIRRELLDERTALVATSVGEHEAFAWLVTRNELTLRRLPERELLARRVRALERTLVAPGPRARGAGAAAAALAEELLAPFVPTLEEQGVVRLLVAADGDLHRVPVRTLLALADLRPVGLREVVHLPSASVQAALERRHRTRRAERGALVVADPVFGDDDPRLGGGSGSSGRPTAAPARGAARAGDEGDLVRLPGTADEATALCGRLRRGPCRSLTGFAATREAILESDLADYRYLHFATHTLVDEEHPERSRIVLSRRDPRGREQPGFLTLDDVRRLELAADLVVLSGCHTATGRAYRGEGPIGLARGFLEAGAASVLVSLWEVDDEATAVLLDRFYEGLFDGRLPPAAALAAAERHVASIAAWSDPYYWAGFQLLGDPPPPSSTRN